MQRREEANRRAEKLLTSKGRPSDLDWLYLWLRARSHGIKSVRELGDLIGHADLRDKGQFVTHLEDLYAMTRFHFSRIQLTRDQLEALDPMISEDSFKAAVQAVVRNLSDKELRDLLGLKRAEAASLAKSALNSVKFRDGYNISIGQANESERKFLNQCGRLLCVKPMFQTDKLVTDFVRCLNVNGLYDYSEPPKLLAERLSTFAIAKLHHTNVKMSGGRIITLEATYDPFSPSRSIIVAAGFDELFGDHSVRVVFPIFESDLAYELVCGDELKLTNHWNFGVEVGEDWLIHMI